MSKTKLLLIIGPTAVGKSSIIEKALEDFPQLVDLITYTTRPMRAGEFEGNPYHFVSDEKFRELMAQDFFLETANVHGRLYGTPKDQVDKATREGKCVIADIDVQGSKKLLTIYPEAETVFLMPPSIDALRERFIKRGVTSPEDLAKRLESAQKEISQAQDFKHVIINDRLDSAYAAVKAVIQGLLNR